MWWIGVNGKVEEKGGKSCSFVFVFFLRKVFKKWISHCHFDIFTVC